MEQKIDERLNAFIEERVKKVPVVLRSGFHKLCRTLIKEGAQWQKENLLKPADGEDLPELEREVVVLVDNFGKLIPKLAKRTYHLIENFVDEDTGEIISIENTDKVCDFISWTEPAIYWLDVDIPKLKED